MAGTALYFLRMTQSDALLEEPKLRSVFVPFALLHAQTLPTVIMTTARCGQVRVYICFSRRKNLQLFEGNSNNPAFQVVKAVDIQVHTHKLLVPHCDLGAHGNCSCQLTSMYRFNAAGPLIA